MKPEELLFHPYETNRSCYLYDAFSNRIYRTDGFTFERICRGDPDDIMHASSVIRNMPIEQFTQEVEDVASRGANYPLSDAEIAEELDRGMNHLLLEVTEKCPLRCEYCIYSGAYRYERVHSAKSMPASISERAVKFFLDYSHGSKDRRTIGFYGGEPLVEYGLVKHCVNYALNTASPDSVRFTINTNGILLTEEKFDFLTQHDILLYVSLDGPREAHDRYRKTAGYRGSFDLITRNLRSLREFNSAYYDAKVHFLCVVANPAELLQLSEFFEQNDLTAGHRVITSPVSPFDLCDNHRQPTQPESMPEVFSKIMDHYSDSVINGLRPNEVARSVLDQPVRRIHERSIGCLKDHLVPNGICIPGAKKLFVCTDGTFLPCERVGQAFPIGTVASGVDPGSVTNLIDQYIRLCDAACFDCWALRLCAACFSHARKGPRLSLERKLQNCQGIRAALHDALIVYSTIMESKSKAVERYLKQTL